jgi:hypothetical protein
VPGPGVKPFKRSDNECLIAKVPHGHRKTLTFVAGLRCDGIIATCVFDGSRSMARVFWPGWFSSWCRPCVRAISWVMDNLSSHKNKTVRHAIRAVGGKLFYLPPYSPDRRWCT